MTKVLHILPLQGCFELVKLLSVANVEPCQVFMLSFSLSILAILQVNYFIVMDKERKQYMIVIMISILRLVLCFLWWIFCFLSLQILDAIVAIVVLPFLIYDFINRKYWKASNKNGEVMIDIRMQLPYIILFEWDKIEGHRDY